MEISIMASSRMANIKALVKSDTKKVIGTVVTFKMESSLAKVL
jgi:hypothetical protein